MDPSCSQSKRDIFEGPSQAPFTNNAENKTDRESNKVDKEMSNQSSGRQPIDDIEREDFEEENRIINQCSSMLVKGEDPATDHFSGGMSGNSSVDHYSGAMSGNSSLASSSEAISTYPMPNDYSLPGCSKSSTCDDSNTTIKNMIHSRKPYVVEEPKPVDFMQKLLSSNTHEKKDFPKGKMYKADQQLESESGACGRDAGAGLSSNASSSSPLSDSTKDFSVPSTSNAEKLLGLSDSGRKTEPGSSKSSVSVCFGVCAKLFCIWQLFNYTFVLGLQAVL